MALNIAIEAEKFDQFGKHVTDMTVTIMAYDDGEDATLYIERRNMVGNKVRLSVKRSDLMNALQLLKEHHASNSDQQD